MDRVTLNWYDSSQKQLELACVNSPGWADNPPETSSNTEGGSSTSEDPDENPEFHTSDGGERHVIDSINTIDYMNQSHVLESFALTFKQQVGGDQLCFQRVPLNWLTLLSLFWGAPSKQM